MRTFRVLHLFSGLGGGALGFQAARADWRGISGSFTTVCGVDSDAEACRDFEALTGAPAVEADIASMTPEDLRAAAGATAPDVVFMSPPCKGFSGLLPAARARSERYQALNRLVLQGLFLVLETWRSAPPRLILVENVPRITSRGAELLLQVKQLLGSYGYRFNEGFHDCGELGGLAQHRRRYLLLARNEAQLPTFVYQPPARRVRAIGEVLGELPLPDDPAAGPLHHLPRLQWRTWVRLALIPAGGDWRDLPAGEYAVTGDPSRFKGRPGLMRVAPWDKPIAAVTGSAAVAGSNGTAAVADQRHANILRVQGWRGPASTVTGAHGVHQGAPAIADPRLPAETDRPDPPPVIVALDGTWHRPLTTLELAALQGLPVTLPGGRRLELAGRADGRWRERIGNAVPPPTAQAIAEALLASLLPASAGTGMVLGSTPIWVEPHELGVPR